MQQATVNLLADMGNVQPQTLMSGLVPATETTDSTPPTSTITSPAAGTVIPNGSTVTVTGTATENTGGVVAGVEISTDGGSTWHPVTTMSAAAPTVTWTYTWAATGSGPVTVETRATNDSGYIETPSDGVSVTRQLPVRSLQPDLYSVRHRRERPDPARAWRQVPVGRQRLGRRRRFYKGTGNNGTHTGSLWSATGTLLATGTFTNETAQRLADPDLREPGADLGQHHLRRGLLRSRRLLRGRPAAVLPHHDGEHRRVPALQPAADGRPGQRQRRERRVQQRRSRLSHLDLPGNRLRHRRHFRHHPAAGRCRLRSSLRLPTRALRATR